MVSERGAEHEAYAPLLRILLEVVDTMYILYMENLEDIVNTHDQLHIRSLGLHELRVVGKGSVMVKVSREIEQTPIVGILAQERIVLVREIAPEHVASQELTPLQLLEQGNTVEEPTVEVPGET